ncbi:MAG: hypothetical protein ABEJ28_05580 [Salinigranum sp.]
MPGRPDRQIRRRRFLKTGALSTAGILGALAGCTGGSGSPGGTGGGSGGENSGTSGGTTSQGDGGSAGGSSTAESTSGNNVGNAGGAAQSKKIRIAAAPLGLLTLPWKQHVEQNGIFEGKMQDAGYPKYNVTWTWEEKVLGASGQADIIVTIGSIEAARLGGNRNLDVVANAAGLLTQYQGWIVKKGGKYDPAVAGSQQKSMDRLVNDNAKVGIGDWAGGHVPPDQLIIKQNWGYDFSENGDFNVITSDYSTLSKLLSEGKLDVAVTGPPLHAPEMMPSSDFKTAPIYQIPPMLKEMGFQENNFALANCVTTKKFADENSDATKAFLSALHEGMTWMSDAVDSNPDQVLKTKQDITALSAQTKKEAEFILDWSYHNYDIPITPPNFQLTDEYIKSDKEALKKAAGVGQVPKNWQDHFGYNKISFQ